MYKKMIISLVVLVVASCNQKESLDDNFKKIVMEYQKKFPIPVSHGKNYVYVTYFNVTGKDTIFLISRSSNGLMYGHKGFGIFQDEILQSTFVYDDDNLSKNFVYARLVNDSAKKFYLNLKKGIRESYPPVYTYSIKNKDINLIKIDTIWNRWD